MLDNNFLHSKSIILSSATKLPREDSSRGFLLFFVRRVLFSEFPIFQTSMPPFFQILIFIFMISLFLAHTTG